MSTLPSHQQSVICQSSYNSEKDANILPNNSKVRTKRQDSIQPTNQRQGRGCTPVKQNTGNRSPTQTKKDAPPRNYSRPPSQTIHHSVQGKNLTDITTILTNMDIMKLAEIAKNPLAKRSFVKSMSSSNQIYVSPSRTASIRIPPPTHSPSHTDCCLPGSLPSRRPFFFSNWLCLSWGRVLPGQSTICLHSFFIIKLKTNAESHTRFRGATTSSSWKKFTIPWSTGLA